MGIKTVYVVYNYKEKPICHCLYTIVYFNKGKQITINRCIYVINQYKNLYKGQ